MRNFTPMRVHFFLIISSFCWCAWRMPIFFQELMPLILDPSTKVKVLLLLPTTVWLFLLFSSSCHSITQKNAHLFPWTYRQELRDNLIDRKVLSSISQNPPPPICQKNIYEMIYIYSKRLKNLENRLIIYCGKQN